MPPYQGARARPDTSEAHRVFNVAKVRLDALGHVTAVSWAEVSPRSNLEVSAETDATVTEVVDAIHAGDQVVAVFPSSTHGRAERLFVAVEHADGQETIALQGPASPGRELHDMDRLNP